MSQTDNFSIVVVGAMNPRLHHPFFYKTIAVISDDEVKRAVEADTTMCMPQIAQLDFDNNVRMICLPDRWQIACPKEGEAERLLEICDRVMTALDHTPTSAVGFNFDFVRPSGRTATEAHFAELGRSLRVGFTESSSSAFATFNFIVREVEPEAARQITVHVAPVPDPAEHVLVKNNFHYQITLSGHFDLGPVLRTRFDRDHRRASSQLARTLDALKVVH